MFSKYITPFLISFLFLFQPITYASEFSASPVVAAAIEQISIETERNVLFKNRLQLLQQRAHQQTTKIDAEALQQLDLTITLVKEDVKGIQLNLVATQQANSSILDYIQVLQSQLQNNRLLSNLEGNVLHHLQAQLSTQLTEQQTLYDLQIKRISILRTAEALVAETLDVAQRWKIHLEIDYQVQQVLKRQAALTDLAASLQHVQQRWLSKLANLNKELLQINSTDFLNNPIYIQLQIELLEAEERGNLAQFQLDLSRAQNGLDNLIFMAEHVRSVSDLNEVQEQVNLIEKNLTLLNITFNQKIDLFQNRHAVFSHQLQINTNKHVPSIPSVFRGEVRHKQCQGAECKRRQMVADIGLQHAYSLKHEGYIIKTIDALLADYTDRQKTVIDLIRQAKNIQKIIADKSIKQLTQRQPLSNFTYLTWVELGEQVKPIVNLLKQRLSFGYDTVVGAIKKLKHWQLILVALFLFLWSYIGFKLKHGYLDLIINNIRQKNRYISNVFLLTSMYLLKCHLAGVMLLVCVCGFLYLLKIPLEVFSLLFFLSVIVLIFRVSISLAYLTLMKNKHEDENNPRFYFHLRWIIFLGGVITILTFIVHELPIAYSIQDLFDRLFMFFLMVIAIILFGSWMKYSVFLVPYLQNKKNYLKKLVRWLIFLIPFGIFLNALIGVLGYVTLAWSMAVYQGIFLVVLTGFLLINGLLGELIQFIVGKLISYDFDGVLWYEMFFKPLYWLLKLVLLCYSVIIFIYFCGWNQQTWIITKTAQILNLKLFVLGNSTITSINILQVIAIVFIFIWVAKWTRELAHRYIFAEIKDAGLRNSLVVFSQYFMVVFGVIIALHISGIDLTSLTVVMSVFAAGIGFGLRDLVNNFISGVLLLIERPVNIGDYVTLAKHEGTVKHIGMRSITVITKGNQALLVPNSQVYSKAFMNWTRCNGIVRSSVTLRINRVDDPHHVKAIILDVLKDLPNVLNAPPVEVELDQLDEVLLEFQVGYYIDMNKISSLTNVRSIVLYAIWDRFKAEGIHPPEVVKVISVQDKESH